jgi:hypothetical protein
LRKETYENFKEFEASLTNIPTHFRRLEAIELEKLKCLLAMKDAMIFLVEKGLTVYNAEVEE